MNHMESFSFSFNLLQHLMCLRTPKENLIISTYLSIYLLLLKLSWKLTRFQICQNAKTDHSCHWMSLCWCHFLCLKIIFHHFSWWYPSYTLWNREKTPFRVPQMKKTHTHISYLLQQCLWNQLCLWPCNRKEFLPLHSLGRRKRQK